MFFNLEQNSFAEKAQEIGPEDTAATINYTPK